MFQSPNFVTMTVVGTAVNLLLNASFLVAFYRHRSSRDIWYWLVGLFLNLVGSFLLAMRGDLPLPLTNWVGGAVFSSFMGFMLLGFQSFFGRRPSFAYAFSVPLIFLLSIFPMMGSSVGLSLGSLEVFGFMATGSVLIARELWLQRLREPLPSLGLASWVYGSFALVLLVCLILGILHPLRAGPDGQIVSPWMSWMMLVIILHKSTCALVILVLVNDRNELKLRKLADTDMLTGVSSRRSFVDAAAHMLEDEKSHYALAIFDLDGFKRINDTYGHLGGDEVLRSFCHVVQTRLGAGMKFGRFGGEEFALVAPGGNPEAFEKFVNNIREAVANTPVMFNALSIPMQVSAGVAFSFDTGRVLDHMIGSADLALYLAKREGRNRVKVYTPSLKLSLLTEADYSVSDNAIRHFG